MIILDFNQIFISNLVVSINTMKQNIEEDFVRHMVLNSIRSYNHKFKNEYGEMIIATDSTNSWRKSVFPQYKANRKKTRKESTLDWNLIFSILNKIRDEVKEHFPYRVIHVDTAEADDIIATLVMNEHKNIINSSEKILILSGDKDFIQLQQYPNVKQYDPVRKRFVTNAKPKMYLKEHIMRGDVGDGIPNFLSSDTCLVLGERQKPIRTEKLINWLTQSPNEFCDETQLRNYKRNEVLIDLTKIPNELQENIYKVYESEANKKRDKIFNYMIKNKLKHLIESVQEF